MPQTLRHSDSASCFKAACSVTTKLFFTAARARARVCVCVCVCVCICVCACGEGGGSGGSGAGVGGGWRGDVRCELLYRAQRSQLAW